MLKKLTLASLAIITAGALGACTNQKRPQPDASQSLQRARIAKPLRPAACNLADIMSAQHLDYSHTIAAIANALSEDPNLNPREKQVNGTNVGLFQVPKGQLQKFAKRRHQKYDSANVQFLYMTKRSGFKKFQRTHGSAKHLAAAFAKDVARQRPVDVRELNRNVNKLENK